MFMEKEYEYIIGYEFADRERAAIVAEALSREDGKVKMTFEKQIRFASYEKLANGGYGEVVKYQDGWRVVARFERTTVKALAGRSIRQVVRTAQNELDAKRETEKKELDRLHEQLKEKNKSKKD